MSGNNRAVLLSLAYVLTIYGTSGQMRALSTLLRQAAGVWLGGLVTVGLVLILGGILFFCRHALNSRRGLLLLPVLLGYGLALWWLTIPEERFHLLQYGILAVICTQALPAGIQGISRHLLAVVLVTLAGIGDELIQWIRPERVGDVRDVLINFVAALLAQFLIAIISPTRAAPRAVAESKE
jgi:glycopeptide antibiotics resistance protein